MNAFVVLLLLNQNIIRSSANFDYTYLYHNGQLIAQRNPDGTKIYIHADAEGSSSVVTNTAGVVIENTSYTPFGGVISGGAKSIYSYEAKETDTLVGDTDFHFRKYCSNRGIFCTPDTIIQNVYDPQSLNKYAFERNSPYNRIDTNGHWVIVVVVVALILLYVSGDLLNPLNPDSPSQSIVDRYVPVDKPYQQTPTPDAMSGPSPSGTMGLASEEEIAGMNKAKEDDRIRNGLPKIAALQSPSNNYMMSAWQPAQTNVCPVPTAKSSSGSSGKSYTYVSKNTGKSASSSFSESEFNKLNSGGVLSKGASSYTTTTIGSTKVLLTVTGTKSSSTSSSKE